MTTYETTVDWGRIHSAAQAVDQARRATIGHDGCADAFGGTYWGRHYEDRGIAGLAHLLSAAESIRSHSWDVIHDAATRLSEASKPQASDYRVEWWSIDSPKGDKRCASHRGAAWRSAVYGGEVVRHEVLVQSRIDARKQSVIGRARVATATAIAVHDLFSALAETGICEYRPQSTICGISDGRIHVQGLAWLRGAGSDDGHPTLDEAQAFVAGESEVANVN